MIFTTTKKFINSYRVQQTAKSFMSYVWSKIPNDCIVEYKFTVGPQIGFKLSSFDYGLVDAKAEADLTLFSVPLSTTTFEKREGKLKDTNILFFHKFQSVDGVATSEEGGYVPMEITSKAGLGVKAGSYSLGGTLGRKSLTDFNYGGTIGYNDFIETSAESVGSKGTLIQEYKYGRKSSPGKIELGWSWEFKCIIGIEMKVVHETTLK